MPLSVLYSKSNKFKRPRERLARANDKIKRRVSWEWIAIFIPWNMNSKECAQYLYPPHLIKRFWQHSCFSVFVLSMWLKEVLSGEAIKVEGVKPVSKAAKVWSYCSLPSPRARKFSMKNFKIDYSGSLLLWDCFSVQNLTLPVHKTNMRPF